MFAQQSFCAAEGRGISPRVGNVSAITEMALSSQTQRSSRFITTAKLLCLPLDSRSGDVKALYDGRSSTVCRKNCISQF
jgi:hypothetical protein